MTDFQLIFESIPGLYLVLRPDLTIVAASDAYLEATMTKRTDIVGRGLFDVFPDNPDDSGATGVRNLRASLNRVMETRTADAMAVQKYDVRRGDDSGSFEVRYWSPVNSPVFDREDRLAYIVHRVKDVTDFVRAATKESGNADESEALRLRAAVIGAEVYQRAQQIQEANRELRGLHAILEARVESRTHELERAHAELQHEMSERLRTEAALRRTEEQFRQAQKMEAIGRLAGGIAHDFNNLLSVILIYGELMRKELEPGHSAQSGLTEILRASERATELTRQLLAFSRQQVLEPQVLDLNVVVRGVEKMLRRVLGEDVDLRIHCADHLGRVKADPGQLEQVLMNLVVNARDAMPTGGTLTIETQNVDVTAAHLDDGRELEPGRHVVLSVRDTGVGMDEATRARIFEPFFTTKGLGKGTGLGLATTFGIVRQSGGDIEVQSTPGAGTTFRIFLPRASGEPSPAASPERRAPENTSQETLLLVEDEEQLRRLAARILEQSGFHVLTAADPLEALRVCDEHAGPIHLLLTDVILPHMNGRQLAERVVARRPDVRVLYMSGYTDDVILDQGVLESGGAFIQKPLTSARLEDKVREVLSARR